MVLKGVVVFTILASLSVVNGLRCRQCHRAYAIEDCTSVVTCAANEECYMDEIITERQVKEYEAGCRSPDVCKSLAAGRKRSGNLITCSRCCTGLDDCNTKMCGIPSLSANANQCYHCQGQTTTNGCTNVQVCQDDEMCYTSATNIGSSETYNFGCYSRRICTYLTKKILTDTDRCAQSHGDPTLCGEQVIRKRRDTTCHVCCGDVLCNTGSCAEVKDRLYKLWKAGVLDINTLQTNASVPVASTTSSSTS